MRFTGEVVGLRSKTTGGTAIEVANLRRVGCADWEDYQGPVEIILPGGCAKAFRIGRAVRLTIEPR